MADAIGPGDWVECINGAAPSGDGQFHIGQVYRVEDVTPPFPCQAHNPCFGLVIEGLKRSRHPTGAYAGCCFRLRKGPWSEWLKTEPAPADREGVPA